MSWFRRWQARRAPSVRQVTIGELRCHSPTLLLAEPMYLFEPVRVEGVPPGRHAVHASIIRYPEGGERVAKIAIRFRPGDAEVRRTLGSIGVDSATVVAIDESTFQAYWKDVGPERIGRTGIPGEHRRVAELIGKRFGLKWREVDFLHSQFLDPISEELEAQIVTYLETFPEYATFPFMYFRIETRNSFDRVSEVMLERRWAEVVLDEASGASVLAVSSGFGDGRYPVEGLFAGDELRAVEVEFIGPAQDKILEAFPILRY